MGAKNTKPEKTTTHSHQLSPNDTSSEAMNTKPEETTIHSHQPSPNDPSSLTPPTSTSFPPTQQDHQNTVPIDQTSSLTPPPSTSIPPTQQDHQNTAVPIDQTSSTSIPPTQQDDQNTAVPIDQTSSLSPPPSSTSIPPTQQDHQNTAVPIDQNSASSPTTTQNKKSEKWGTHIMGPPAPPSSHPNNQKAAALWTAEEHNEPQQHPYVQYPPVDPKSSSNNPSEPGIHVFNSWSTKTESLARNIWQNLKTGSSVSEAVYGKVGLTTKVLTGGGFEALYKQTFNVTDPNEKLKKTFACYLSTSTGPVAGTLYLTNIHVAFCSDRPLTFPAPSGQVSWSYYKAIVPLEKISSINPINMKEKPVERYIQIATVDNHDFWLMGFVNYDKASSHLSQSSSESVAAIADPV